jgi:hypothetical protein
MVFSHNAKLLATNVKKRRLEGPRTVIISNIRTHGKIAVIEPQIHEWLTYTESFVLSRWILWHSFMYIYDDTAIDMLIPRAATTCWA